MFPLSPEETLVGFKVKSSSSLSEHGEMLMFYDSSLIFFLMLTDDKLIIIHIPTDTTNY